MFHELQEHPGLWFVAATLTPLASFVLLLLAGGLRWALRPARDNDTDQPLYQLLGGDRPQRAGAYIATGAMALAFLFSLIGAANYAAHPAHEPEEHARLWAGHLDWARVSIFSPSLSQAPADGVGRASALSLGYRIDSLTVVMFLMVTLIGGLIHLFSIGYMSDELEPTVEDHQVHTETGHLKRRGRFGRFFLFMSLFCFSMLNLVLADNLFQVFISWELVGICSYLLISFYYERQSASNAANKAFIVNRIGDAGFIVGLLIFWSYLGTFNFHEIFSQIRCPVTSPAGQFEERAGEIVRANVLIKGPEQRTLQVADRAQGSEVLLFPVAAHENGEKDEQPLRSPKKGAEVLTRLHPLPNQYGSMPYWLLVAGGLGIFMGCVGKSAQFPLHVWLPDAMEGPTPVSALIHAATMVAAGVYLVGRCYPLFAPEALLVIAYTGGITLFVAATIAVVMTDIKKVLAYSTVSQLGYMMLALGVGGWAAGLFHLTTHAFFKALLFLCSGSVIYGCHHEQDMMRMGGLYPKMKITALTMLTGVLAICGIPLFSGWYSKDAILAHAVGFVWVNPQHLLLLLLPLVTAGITAFYMFRMWFLTFAGKPKDEHVFEHAHESPWVMTVPLTVLAFFSIVVAWGWPIIDPEASTLERVLHHSQHASVAADFGVLPEDLEQAAPFLARADLPRVGKLAVENHFFAGAMTTAVGALGIAFAFLLYYFRLLDPVEAKAQFPAVHRFLWNKWYFDEFYSVLLVRPALTVAGWCRAFDAKAIDGTVDSLANVTVEVSRWAGKFDLGIIDGLVNLTARVIYGIGGRLRGIQTGFIRSYVLFLVMAAIAIFGVMVFVVSRVIAR
jgi:NADH-quinone oxidoreductase subunit L